MTRSLRQKKLQLEKKVLEEKLDGSEGKDEYSVWKENLNAISDEIANGIIIRSRCNWYELGDKSSKFFLNSEKYWTTHNIIKNVIHDAQETTDHKKITIFFVL